MNEISKHDRADADPPPSAEAPAPRRPAPTPPPADRKTRWVFALFFAAALLFLFVEHRAHVLGWLPWVLLLLCLSMPLWMHRHHGDGKGHD